MKIKLQLIPEEGLRIEGDDPPSILDLREALYRFEQPIHYALEFSRMEGDAVLVRGTLSTVARARCVRSLEWFDLPLHVPEFTCHHEQPGDELDLTPEIREDILLALPQNPVAPDAKTLETFPASQNGGRPAIWQKLDQLKIKSTR